MLSDQEAQLRPADVRKDLLLALHHVHARRAGRGGRSGASGSPARARSARRASGTPARPPATRSGPRSAATRASSSSPAPSSTTSNSTWSTVIPGCLRSSSFIAAHLAAPTLEPSASARASCSASADRCGMSAEPELSGRSAIARVSAGASSSCAAVEEASSRGAVPAVRQGDRRRAAGHHRGRRRRQTPDHELLPQRPEVGRDPVDDQAGREVRDEGREHEREEQHDALLGLVRGHRHDQRRRHLRADEQHHQHDQLGAGRLGRDVRDEQEVRIPGGRHLVLELAARSAGRTAP